MLFFGQCRFCQRSRLKAVAHVCLVGQSHSCRLSLLLLSKQRTCTAFLLILQAGESSFVLLLPGSHPGKPDLETAVANP
jgi:hypothetical protein